MKAFAVLVGVVAIVAGTLLVPRELTLGARVRVPTRGAEELRLVTGEGREVRTVVEPALTEVFIRIKNLKHANRLSGGHEVKLRAARTSNGGSLIDRSQYRLIRGTWVGDGIAPEVTGWRAERPLAELGWRGQVGDIELEFETSPFGGTVRLFRDRSSIGKLDLYSETPGTVRHVIPSPSRWLTARLPLAETRLRLVNGKGKARQPQELEIFQGGVPRAKGPGRQLGTPDGYSVFFTWGDMFRTFKTRMRRGGSPLVVPLRGWLARHGTVNGTRVLVIGSWADAMTTGKDEELYRELSESFENFELFRAPDGERSWRFGLDDEGEGPVEKYDYVLAFQGYHLKKKRPGLLQLCVGNEVFRLYHVGKLK